MDGKTVTHFALWVWYTSVININAKLSIGGRRVVWPDMGKQGCVLYKLQLRKFAARCVFIPWLWDSGRLQRRSFVQHRDGLQGPLDWLTAAFAGMRCLVVFPLGSEGLISGVAHVQTNYLRIHLFLGAMYSSVNCSHLELKLSILELLEQAAYKDLCNDSSRDDPYFDPEDLNMTIEELRLKYLGPRRSGFFVPICTTYLLIFVVGAVGNALTCLVIIQHRFMRTPTNYYLFSLAVSDLLVLLLGMPLEIYEMWSNYPFLLGAGGCCFKTLLFEAVCFASILNVTALSVERYIAVVHPLKAKYVVTKNHAKRVIITVWVLSIICSIPNTSLHGIQTLHVPARGVVPDSATCTLVKSRLMYNLIIQVTTIIFFFVPMGVISVLYLLIGLQLRKEKMLEALEAKSASNCDYHNIRLQQKKVRRRQVTNMLFALVVVFGICWAPFHTDRLVWSFVTHWTDQMLGMFQYVHIISGVFFYLSSAANPILYNLMSTRFREMFKDVMCRRRFQKLGSRKHSPSSTRVTMRSTVSEHVGGGDGQPLSDLEDYEADPERDEAEECEGPFL
ncbi:neuromedin-U receptor 1 [Podarcis lilfordi]|uniref:Neuromedin-U receptor 1 n=1 Tax=Podarcis lilfordi TaxID=74358 RepID=A0AA35KD20_9SAUR|nr:neuromedin-U receptor 1 [Podarcis lilfordi]